MITIACKNKKKEYIDFLIKRFDIALSECWIHRENKCPSPHCTECKDKLACFDMQSALNHLKAVQFRMENKGGDSVDS